MDTASFVKRFALVAVLPALAFASQAGAAAERATGVSLNGPRRIVQGGDVSFTAQVRPTNARCSLAVRYRSGTQRAGTAIAKGGKATFKFKVARRAAPGRAVATVSCPGAGKASLSLMVIGSVIPPTITVIKQGFSIRPRRTGADTSWGVIVRNDSPTQDAVNVTILANYVMPDNRLIGSMTVRVGRIAAGKEHATGGDLSFPGVPPVARLEITAQIGSGEPADRRMPGISNVRIVPERFDPSFVGSVEGEVVNDNATARLYRAELSTVVLDAGGNVLGGGRSFANASLPPGSRQFFKIPGMDAVPFAQAATAMVSVAPTYR